MVKFRYTSESDPLGEPRIARKAALAMIRAEAMGLLSPEEALADVDASTFRTILERLQSAGAGRGLVREAAAVYGTERLESLLDALLDALTNSPVPGHEWTALERVFDAERLAALLDISAVSLRRYSSGARTTPDDIAARLHFLALVVGDLSGSYNDIGVRRWFERKRSQLDGKAPQQFLRGGWDPEDAGPVRVRALAAALLGSVAT